MNRVETIQERLQRLPAKAQEEVLEALEQIEQRYQTKESSRLSKPEDEFEYRIYKHILKELLQDFSEYEKTLITMNKFDGYKPKEIAAMLEMDLYEVNRDLNLSWIKFRNRARKILKNKPTLDLKRTAPDEEFEADMIIFTEGTENISHTNGAYSREDIYFDHD